MPFVNLDQPNYRDDEPDFLRAKMKTSFDSFVVACQNGQQISQEKFAELWNMRWTSFSAGVLDAGVVFMDVLAADRFGYTVDLPAAFDLWLDRQREMGSG